MSITFSNDSDYPLAVAQDDGSSFGFACPFCRARLCLTQIEFRELITCPTPACGRVFRVATTSQIKLAMKGDKRRRQSIQDEVRRLQQSGAMPPDRISVFGITNAGKSVFLASLYHCLWNRLGRISGRAKHGLDHQNLLADHAVLQRGQWLAATTSTRTFDLAIQYGNVRATLTSIDYPGEVLTDVLFRKQQRSAEQIGLYDQLHSTLGAIILVDPEQVASVDGTGQRLDVEYTGIEVAEHMNARGVGDHIVVVLTKRNRNEAWVRRHGGPRSFLQTFLPRLVEAAPAAPVLHISAVGTTSDAAGRTVPATSGFDVTQVTLPLLTLFERIDPAYLALLQQIDQDALDAANQAESRVRLGKRTGDDRGGLGARVATP